MAATPAGILLVEGRDDEEVVKQFCNRHEIDNRSLFEFAQMGGFPRLVEELRVWPRESRVNTVAAAFDANTDPDSRWAAIRGSLERAGYSALPTRMPAEGLVLAADGPLHRLGVWMMPDNTSPGMLEDFLRSLVTDADALLPRAQRVVDEIPAPESEPTTT